MQFSVEVETSKPARSLQEVWCKTSGERNIGVAALLIRVSQQTKVSSEKMKTIFRASNFGSSEEHAL